MKTTFDAGLLISLDRKSVVPLRQQIERAIRSAVRSGRVSEGEFLPASRTLASRLTVGRGVVVEAYEQLAAEGYLVTQSGSGTRVSSVGARSQPQDELPLRSRWWPQYDFRPGMPDLQTFPKREWLACLRKALSLPNRETLGYPDPAGPLTTREALAAYLARSRATIGGSGRIVLCNGFTQGIDLVARLLKAAGVTCVAVEDPGFDGLMALFSSLNIETTRVPVDEQGLVVEMLARTQAGAVLVTPAHQYPSGIGLAPGRRAELIRWAYRRNALIIEDDYDAEFRYDRQPVGSLQGLAPERVMYIGTTSKTLSPALRLGWILSPVEHVNTLSRLKRRSDRGSATLDQLALAAFLGDGHMDRHLKGMRALYRDRRDALMDALREHFPQARVQGVAAGLHVMVMLPDGTDEQALVRAAAERSIRVFGSRQYWSRQETAPPALVLGYGGLERGAIDKGIRKLSELIREAVSGKPRPS